MREKEAVKEKTAIAVYNPQDPLERAVQEAYHEHNDGWLHMYPCQLAAKALASLKMFDEEWLENDLMFEHRVRYFFAPFMSAKKDQMVFATTLLFLRDILENRAINGFTHNPVVFVTRPLAHYLLREYPVHVLFDMDKIYAANRDCQYLDVGGLVIFDGENIDLPDGSMLDVFTKDSKKGESPTSSIDLNHITEETGFARKVAVSLREPGVFTNDEHKRSIRPQQIVWDKSDRLEGTVVKVEPGEMGTIEVLLDNGTKKIISQSDFDREFALV
jgi:hypothetical protein